MIGREPWFSGYGRSWVQIPAPDTQWSFFTLICFKNCIGFSKDRNKMEKRPRKTLSIPNIGCWFPLIRTTSSLNIPLWHKPTLSLSHTFSLTYTRRSKTRSTAFRIVVPLRRRNEKCFDGCEIFPRTMGWGKGAMKCDHIWRNFATLAKFWKS